MKNMARQHCLFLFCPPAPPTSPSRNRLRMYPAFISCTTIDWFSEWPDDALLEVAEKYLEDTNLGEVKVKPQAEGSEVKSMRQNMACVFVVCHRSVMDMSERMLFEMRRHNYVTPSNYLELVSGYKK